MKGRLTGLGGHKGRNWSESFGTRGRKKKSRGAVGELLFALQGRSSLRSQRRRAFIWLGVSDGRDLMGCSEPLEVVSSGELGKVKQVDPCGNQSKTTELLSVICDHEN